MSEELKNKLKQAREKLGLTQQQFAEKIGVPYPTLFSWEQNKRTPRGFALKALNDVLDAILAAE